MNRLLAKVLGVAQDAKPRRRATTLQDDMDMAHESHLLREVRLDERDWLPPPLGQPFMIGQLRGVQVHDGGPWRGVSRADWVARFRVPTDSPVSDDEVVW